MLLYGWNKGDLGFALGIGSVTGVLSIPVLASLSLRFGLRKFMVGGAVNGWLLSLRNR